ncbi:ABC transporter permease [Filobacillus milosensis]|uniref:ABC transporter permease n=1 Tax=Filobacillus milosensis TaxID=94137 RepID=A0A4Y8IND0_9BACI|nr:ABC transporter permease [Filobacillus milosensis]TFB22927.1 ABC transporter permease [Filobacillus milosensis]
MWSFLKKDILVLFRDKTELAVLLLMPLVLTSILGFALGGVMSGSTEGISSSVAFVQKGQTEQDVKRFKEEVKQLPIPDEAKAQISEAVDSFQPVNVITDVFNSDEFNEMFQIKSMNETDALSALSNEEVSAILIVPEDFTYEALRKMVLEQGEGSELIVQTGDHSSFSASIFEDVIEIIINQLNLGSAIAKETGEEGVVPSFENDSSELGDVQSVTDKKPMSPLQYYTFAMGVMFALYVGSTMAHKGYVENFQNVFNRIILSGKHPMMYLSGKGISTMLLVFIQLVILFTISVLVLRSFMMDDIIEWAGIALITFVYAISIGSVGALLTSITMRANSSSITGVFSGGIVSILAFLGGSFVPKTQLPEFISVLGGWTPNGLALTSYLQWSQGLGFDFILPSLIKLLIFTIIILSISLMIFPRKRVV